MPERLRRLDRVFERHPIYFVTACTHNRQSLLANPEIQTAIHRFAEQGPAHGAWLGAYVLMPDHLHAFVALGDPVAAVYDRQKPPDVAAVCDRPNASPTPIPGGHRHAATGGHRHAATPEIGGHRHAATALPQLSLWMKSLKNSLSKVMRNNGQEAPHWQKGFFDHILRSSESYGQKWDYVQQNPVRAGLVLDANNWPYSGQPFPLEYRHDWL